MSVFLARIGRIGAEAGDDDETALHKRLAVVLCLGTLPLTMLWSATYLWAGVPIAAAIPAVYSVLTPINTALFSWTRAFALYRTLQLLMILVLPWLLTLSLGGFEASGIVIVWAALCPLGSLLLEEPRQTLVWLLAFVGLLAVGALLQPTPLAGRLPAPLLTWFIVLNVGSVTVVTFALLYHFVERRNFFQRRSEALLLDILPREICDTLKARPQTIAAQHSAASVLFADVVAFAPLATSMAPLHLVRLLNELFHAFDALVDKHGMEKIKTIGDCYMVAAGVPGYRDDHAQALVDLALDMLAAVDQHTFGGRKLALRIGVDSGPVVAGVIGCKKFSYDLWGETVNLASRMQSQGQVGAVQITARTFDLIKHQFDCLPLGAVPIKGAARIHAWQVIGRRVPDTPPVDHAPHLTCETVRDAPPRPSVVPAS